MFVFSHCSSKRHPFSTQSAVVQACLFSSLFFFFNMKQLPVFFKQVKAGHTGVVWAVSGSGVLRPPHPPCARAWMLVLVLLNRISAHNRKCLSPRPECQSGRTASTRVKPSLDRCMPVPTKTKRDMGGRTLDVRVLRAQSALRSQRHSLRE